MNFEAFTVFLTVLSATAAVAVFFIVYSYRRNRTPKNDETVRQVVNSDLMERSTKICPVCRHKLSEDDVVFIKTYEAEPEDKLFIKGCVFCYNPQTRKSSVRKKG